MREQRSPEQMKELGLTDEGIALVEALSDVVASTWKTRAGFLRHVAVCRHQPHAGVTRALKLNPKSLSRQFGSGRKPQGPDWLVAQAIVDHATEGPEDLGRRRELKARIAGLYATARGVATPEGYTGPITWPPRAVADDEAVVEVEREGTLFARVQAQLLDAQTELTDQRQVIAMLEQENNRLTEQLMSESAGHAATRARLQEAKADLLHQQEAQADVQMRLKDQALRAETAEKRLANLRERHAALAAQFEATMPPTEAASDISSSRSGHRGRNVVGQRQLAATAPAPQRALAVYFQTLIELTEKSEVDLAMTAGVSEGTLARILTAEELTELADAESLGRALGGQIATVRRLHHAAENPALAHGSFEDIVAQMTDEHPMVDGDNLPKMTVLVTPRRGPASATTAKIGDLPPAAAATGEATMPVATSSSNRHRRGDLTEHPVPLQRKIPTAQGRDQQIHGRHHGDNSGNRGSVRPAVPSSNPQTEERPRRYQGKRRRG